MKIHKPYLVELYPKQFAARQIDFDIDCSRAIYNMVLELKIKGYELDWVSYSSYDLIKILPYWKEENPWLKRASNVALQQAIQDLGRAFSNVVNRRFGLPKFKKKGKKSSCRYVGKTTIALDMEHKKVRLPKIGWVKFRGYSAIPGRVTSITVSKRAGRYFASILTEQDIGVKIPNLKGNAVGLDVGRVRMVTTSDGAYVPGVNNSDIDRKVAILRRKLERQTKGSSNYSRTLLKLQRLEQKRVNKKKDIQHKFTTDLVKNHDIVCREDLDIEAMTRSASGTKANPGKGVAQKRGLNREIRYQGWGELFRQIGYKSKWYGCHVETVNPKNTSRQCPECLHISADNRKTQSKIKCIACGHEDNADHNASVNVLRAGLAQIACRVSGAARPPAARTSES